MSKLLLDTNFIVAAILPNDELHERAVKLEIKENLTVSNECYVVDVIYQMIFYQILQYLSQLMFLFSHLCL